MLTSQENITPCAQETGAVRKDAGFSLLELMVVVVILSILALVIAPRIIDRPDQARVARVQSDLAVIQSAVKLYRLDNFRYPSTEQGLRALVNRPSTEPVPRNWAENGYIDRLPVDPWGNEYQYLSPGVHGEFDVFTLGADGVTGGSGADADLGTWTLE
ncbi:type II secretion system major pseudopilin GspG [Neptunicoccus cionae]|uniref:Type II secretion system core protein G n=1 Tax=Neptunicoccus cionae TaxID=2035344 RepID=A0A916R2F3_9RHOB|nr:type II secretion system major pseudopilin GspG [Amylibacter cionae]GGA29455.1 type II secretion system protein GspG [Amylibacter cionae]